MFRYLIQAKSTASVKQVYYRKIKSIDIDSFGEDLARSDLCNASYTDVKELSSLYNHTLTSLLDVHA